MPEGLSLGTGYISLLPSWDEWGAAVDAQFATTGSATGKQYGALIATGLTTSAGEAGTKAGEEIADSLATTGTDAGTKLGADIAEGLTTSAGEAGTKAGEEIATGLDSAASDAGTKAGEAISEGLSTGASEGTTKAEDDLGDVATKGEETGSRLGSAFSSAGQKGGAFSGMLLQNMQMAGVSLGPIGEGMNTLTEATQGLGEKWDELETPVQKFGAGVAAAGAATTAVGALLIEASDSSEKAEAGLDNAIKNTGASADAYKSKIEDVVKTEANHGVSISQTDQALQQLIQASGSASKGISEMSTVDNLAAATHVSLAAAAKEVTQAELGKGRALTQLGIQMQGHVLTDTQLAAAQAGITKATDAVTAAFNQQQILTQAVTVAQAKLNATGGDTAANQLALEKAQEAAYQSGVKLGELNTTLTNDQNQLTASQNAGAYAMQQINDKTKGAAAALADTFGGKIDAVKTKIGNFVAEEGAKFGKWMVAAGPLLMGIGAGMDLGTKAVGLFSKGAEAASEAGEAATGATEGLTAATEGMAVADDAAAVSEGVALAPILLIIAGVAALALGIYELVTHWKTVWADIEAVGSDAEHIVVGAFDDIKSFIAKWGVDILAVIAPFIGIPILIVENFGSIVDFFGNLWGDISGAFSAGVSTVVNVAEEVPAWFEALPGRILGVVASAGTWLLDTGTKALEGLLTGAERGAQDLITWVTTVDAKILGALGDAGVWLLDEGKKAIEGLLTGAEQGAVDLVAWAATIDAKILGALGDAGTWLLDEGKKALEGLLSGAKTGFTDVASWFASLPGTVGGWAKDAGSWLLSAGKDIIDGLWTGIQNEAASLPGKVAGLIKDVIPGPIAKILGIASPSTVTAEFGKNVMQGLAGGMTDNAHLALGATTGAVASITGALAGLKAVTGTVASIPVAQVTGAAGGGSGALGAQGGAVNVSPGAVVLNFNGNVDATVMPQVEAIVNQGYQGLLNAIMARSPRAA